MPAQSTRLASYEAAAQDLLARGLLYPCTCTRAEIAALKPRIGPEGLVYTGTCRGKRLDPDKPAAQRLDLERAMQEVGEVVWEDERAGVAIADPRDFGDVVLVRKDAPASYHLAATLDDAADGVTLVTRGMDLFGATHVHRVLQGAARFARAATWHHHPLLLDAEGEKLAKRRSSPSLGDRRRAGEDGRALADALRAHRFPAGISLSKP